MLVLVVGPSGAGKDSVLEAARALLHQAGITPPLELTMKLPLLLLVGAVMVGADSYG